MLTRIIVLIALVAVLLAADVTGKWKGQIEGQDRETVLTLKAEGSAVTGTMSDPEGKPRNLKGTIDGDKVDLTVDSEWQGNPVKLLLKGTASADELKLTVSSENGEWSAGLTAKRQ